MNIAYILKKLYYGFYILLNFIYLLGFLYFLQKEVKEVSIFSNGSFNNDILYLFLIFFFIVILVTPLTIKICSLKPSKKAERLYFNHIYFCLFFVVLSLFIPYLLLDDKELIDVGQLLSLLFLFYMVFLRIYFHNKREKRYTVFIKKV